MGSSWKIDLNGDLGEYKTVSEQRVERKLIEVISSANIACGMHAGGKKEMLSSIKYADRCGVAVGAHIGLDDKPNFGRVWYDVGEKRLRSLISTQIMAIRDLSNDNVKHVKPHGALYNEACKNEKIADIVVSSIESSLKGVIHVVLAGSIWEKVAKNYGVKVVAEAFADRAYTPDGQLVSRKLKGSVITSPEVAANRAVTLAKYGYLEDISGNKIEVDAKTICIHSDTIGAVAIAHKVKESLISNDVQIVDMEKLIE